jgi:ABC-type transport system involved in multi-copper enzyme maturation permease subunit
MIWKIAKKEFLLNLMTFKFAVATVVSIVLTVIFTPILAKDYQQRLRTYHDNVARNEAELRKVKVYKNITPTISRRPSALSVFSEGLEKRIGDSATIELDKVPEISPAAAEGNPYQSVFPVFDTLLIFKIVIGVLALLVAYDTVSGERERGTLKLMLSGTTRRYEVLLAKLLAGLLVLVVPVTITFVVGLVILISFPMVDLTGSDWIRIGLMYLASLIFISAMYNVGLLFSCLTRRAAISLVLGLFLWVLFAVVIPNGSVYLAAEVRPLEPQEKVGGQMMALKQEYQSELDRSKPPRSGGGIQSNATGAFGRGYDRLLDKTAMEYRQKSYRLVCPLRIKYADKYWEVERSYLNSLSEQKNLADNLSRISPISLFESVMSTLAGTDMVAFQRFMDGVRTHRTKIVEYVRSKTEGFSSPSFFTPCTEEEMAEYEKSMVQFITQVKQGQNQAEIARLTQTMMEWVKKRMAETPNLDLRDCPRFTSMPGALGNLQRAIPDLVLLIFANVLFFAVAFAAFVRYDVR